MDDPRRFGGRYSDDLQQTPVPIRTDHKQSLLALVVVFDESYGVGPGVQDVGVVDPVPVGRLPNLHLVKLALTFI